MNSSQSESTFREWQYAFNHWRLDQTKTETLASTTSGQVWGSDAPGVWNVGQGPILHGAAVGPANLFGIGPERMPGWATFY